MSVFADSSALVTRYADQPGGVVLGAADEIVVSALARVEVPSAIWRKHRMGELSTEDAALLVAAFEADYFGTEGGVAGFAVVHPGPAVLDRAARLVAVHPLRAYDAIQLASAPLPLRAWRSFRRGERPDCCTPTATGPARQSSRPCCSSARRPSKAHLSRTFGSSACPGGRHHPPNPHLGSARHPLLAGRPAGPAGGGGCVPVAHPRLGSRVG